MIGASAFLDLRFDSESGQVKILKNLASTAFLFDIQPLKKSVGWRVNDLKNF